jgi:hypothetical protein
MLTFQKLLTPLIFICVTTTAHAYTVKFELGEVYTIKATEIQVASASSDTDGEAGSDSDIVYATAEFKESKRDDGDSYTGQHAVVEAQKSKQLSAVPVSVLQYIKYLHFDFQPDAGSIQLARLLTEILPVTITASGDDPLDLTFSKSYCTRQGGVVSNKNYNLECHASLNGTQFLFELSPQGKSLSLDGNP